MALMTSPPPVTPMPRTNRPAVDAYWKQVQAQQHPVTPVGLTSPLQSSFDASKLATNQSYKLGLANNAFQDGTLRNNFVQQFRDLAQKYTLQRAAAPYSYNHRGMLGSGVYHQGVEDMAQMNLRNFGALQANETGQLGNLESQKQQLLSQRDMALAQIEQQRQAAINSIGVGTIK